jgi:hypothetical protein
MIKIIKKKSQPIIKIKKIIQIIINKITKTKLNLFQNREKKLKQKLSKINLFCKNI